MKPIDLSTMSPDEIVAEADRRWAERLRKAVPPPPPPPQEMTAVIPFTLLVSDNERSAPVIMKTGGKPYPRLVLNRKYKQAKEKIRLSVRAQCPTGWVPLTGPVTVRVEITEPDRKRVRDITNWCKQLGDACSGVLYEDDGQVCSATYVRLAPDPETARAVITVRNL